MVEYYPKLTVDQYRRELGVDENEDNKMKLLCVCPKCEWVGARGEGVYRSASSASRSDPVYPNRVCPKCDGPLHFAKLTEGQKRLAYD